MQYNSIDFSIDAVQNEIDESFIIIAQEMCLTAFHF